MFTSGYAEPEVVKRGQMAGARWLRKPHPAIELARALRQMLDPTAK